MKVIQILLFLALFVCREGISQKQQYRVGIVGFYNLENLFDTDNDPNINDEEFTPDGLRKWTPELYADKLGNLSQVISELGTEISPDGVAILGVSEIENRKVLEDLVKQPKIAARNYQIVQFDSPDMRGIDVGLLYQPKYFKVTASRAIPLMIYDDSGERIRTRDILFVSGELDGEPLHVLVNHWPSRRGGEAASQPLRNAGAMVCKQVVDSLINADPSAKVMIMGDLNDDPTSPSVRKVLAAKGKIKDVRSKGLFNPMFDLYKKGIGTLAYQDAWNLFDQIILSKGLISPRVGGYQYFQVKIHNPAYLFQKSGHFKGYPFRTFDGDVYAGGYSDHFPVYVVLAKKVD
ncbi:MAG: endonuclease/exonuclease/phosphatase family protein [Lewinella sp.]|nr:endonuclease/exonuclease/phosphatase family protein [Lewinella sp.]